MCFLGRNVVTQSVRQEAVFKNPGEAASAAPAPLMLSPRAARTLGSLLPHAGTNPPPAAAPREGAHAGARKNTVGTGRHLRHAEARRPESRGPTGVGAGI